MRHKLIPLVICLIAISVLGSKVEASSSNSTPLSFQTFGSIKVASPHAKDFLFNNKSATFYPPVTIESADSKNPNQFVIHSGEVKITSSGKSGRSAYIATFAGPVTYSIVQRHAPMVRTITGSADKARYDQSEGLLSLLGNLRAKVQDNAAFSSPGTIQATSLLIHTGTDRYVEVKGTVPSDFMQFHPAISDQTSKKLQHATVTINQFSQAVFNESEEVRITGDTAHILIDNGPLSLVGNTTANSILADFNPKHFGLDMNGKIVTDLDWKPSSTTESTVSGHCSGLNYSETAKLMHLTGGVHVLETEMDNKKEIHRKISVQAEEMQIPTEGTSNLSIRGASASDRVELAVFSGVGSLPASEQSTEHFSISSFDQLLSESNSEYKIIGAGSTLNYSVDPTGTTAQVLSPLITAKMPVQGSPTEIQASGGVQFHYETPQTKDLNTGNLINTVLGVKGNTKSFDLILASRKKPVTDSVLTLIGPSILTLKLTGQKTPVTYTDKIDDRVVLNLTQSTIDWFSNSHTASLTFTPNPSSANTPTKKVKSHS